MGGSRCLVLGCPLHHLCHSCLRPSSYSGPVSHRNGSRCAFHPPSLLPAPTPFSFLPLLLPSSFFLPPLVILAWFLTRMIQGIVAILSSAYTFPPSLPPSLPPGVHYPALTSLITHRLPEEERSFLYGVIHAGAHVGWVWSRSPFIEGEECTQTQTLKILSLVAMLVCHMAQVSRPLPFLLFTLCTHCRNKAEECHFSRRSTFIYCYVCKLKNKMAREEEGEGWRQG